MEADSMTTTAAASQRPSSSSSRRRRRNGDRLGYDESSSSGGEEGGGGGGRSYLSPGDATRKKRSLVNGNRNSLVLTADEDHISPIDSFDSAPVHQRLYSYLSGSDDEEEEDQADTTVASPSVLPLQGRSTAPAPGAVDWPGQEEGRRRRTVDDDDSCCSLGRSEDEEEEEEDLSSSAERFLPLRSSESSSRPFNSSSGGGEGVGGGGGGGGGRGTIEGCRGAAGENFYSRISDESTLPRPNIFIPPPPTDPGPPMPPRFPLVGPRTTSSGTQTTAAAAAAATAGPAASALHRHRGYPLSSVGAREDVGEFLAKTADGCLFVPAGQTSCTPTSSPVLSRYAPQSRCGAMGAGGQAGNSSVLVPLQNCGASLLLDPILDVDSQHLHHHLHLQQQQQPWSPQGQTNNVVGSNTDFIRARPTHVAQCTTLPQDWLKDSPGSLCNSSTSCQVKDNFRQRCTWKYVAFIMILVTITLSAIVAYLTAMKLHSLSWHRESPKLIDEEDHHTTATYVQASSDGDGIVSLSSSLIAQYPFGQRSVQQIAPHAQWKTQFYLPEGQSIKFNFSLDSSDAVFGIYGRRNAQPSHTRYDFFRVIEGQALMPPSSSPPATSLVRLRRSDQGESSTAVESAFVEYLDSGLWYLFIYNDCDTDQGVAFLASRQSGLISDCPEACHGRGDCVDGHCKCFNGYYGPNCMQTVCPILCQGHGLYAGGQCQCFRGWKGPECETPTTDCDDPGCSGNGICVEGVCVCSPGYTGSTCARELCVLQCIKGRCHGQRCLCDAGWTGDLCDSAECDARCTLNGICMNGTCLCNTGWNGKHCTINGCPELCGNHGQCQLHQSSWTCVCDDGWTGGSCAIAFELICDDNLDDDQDKMIDCQDPDCCLSPVCRDTILCKSAPDPTEIVLRKQPPSSAASFYDRMCYLIEDDSVQSYATLSSFNHSQVSVVRGRAVNSDGLPLVGVRVSVLTQPLYGFTLTREQGLFDILVNGGGSVTISFQRQLFRTTQVTVMVPWNRMVTMDTVVMVLEGRNATKTAACPGVEHDCYNIRPLVLSTWQHTQLGACPSRSTIIPESQVLQESLPIAGTALYLVYHSSEAAGYMSTLMIQLTNDQIPPNLAFVLLQVHVEGLVHERLFEAEPNLKYKFAWDRRNAYNQKVFGIVSTNVNVGYKYRDCERTFWEKQSTTLSGYAITSSEIGGWNLNIHHTYNFQEGILHKGDGTNIYLKERPRKVVSILGNGRPRRTDCRGCDGRAEEGRLLAPVALASGRDGSIYIGDYNHIRKLVASREEVTSILQLSMSEVPYIYYMTVSPLDGKLYISDHQSLRIIRVKTMGAVRDLAQNFEVIAGTGNQCVPGDPEQCGDSGLATNAHLLYPKGIAINKNGVVYFADGANIRSIDSNGYIDTVIGSQGQPKYWMPLPCNRILSASEVTLHWPTALAISPLDDTLHIVDNNMVLKVTGEGKVIVVAGRPLHCPPKNITGRSLLSEEHSGPRMATDEALEHLRQISFAANGDLYLVESDGKTLNQVRMVNTDGEIVHYAGARSKCDCSRSEECSCFDPKEELAVNMLLNDPTAVAVTPDGVLHVADMGNLRVHSVLAALPAPNRLGQYEVLHAPSREMYVFNRYGHHLATKNFVTDRYLYNFTYNVNSYYGKLMKVRDAGGNVLEIRRDYRHLATEILLAGRRICRLLVDNMGQLQTFVAAADDSAQTTFRYAGNGGLVESKQTTAGHVFLYDYDANGRLEAVTHPTGRRTRFVTDVDRSGALVRIDADDDNHKVTMATNRNVLSLRHGDDHAIRVSNLKDGSLTLEYPFDMAVTLETSPHPLLSTEHPLNVRRTIILPNGLVHRLDWRYFLRHEGGGGLARRSRTSADRPGHRLRVGRPRHGGLEAAMHASGQDAVVPYWGYEGKVLSVNGEVLLTFEYDREDNTEFVQNRQNETVLVLVYDSSGRPVQVLPKEPLEGLNLTYDAHGHVTSWSRGELTVAHVYDEKTGYLVEKRIANRMAFRYLYRDSRKPTDIILPSGKQYQIQYDESSNLRTIILPSLARHEFRYISLPEIYRISYQPPGTVGPYILDYGSDGQLVQILYPSNRRRVMYYYNEFGLLSRVIFDWADVSRTYDSATLKLRSAVIENRGPSSYSCSLAYGGATEALVTSHSVVCSQSRGPELLNADFRYAYDGNFRTVTRRARFGVQGGGGETVQSFNYSAESGRLTSLSSFRFDYQSLYREVITDRNIQITLEFDRYGRLADEWFAFNDYVVFNKEVKYDSLGRIYQWRRKVGSSDLRAYEYVYDIDGSVVEVLVNSQSTWKYEIDAGGNVVRITHHSTVQDIVINGNNQVESCGRTAYVVDGDGFVARRDREVFEYSALGQLVRAFQPNAFDVRFYYDAENRIVALSNPSAQQFFYADLRNPDRVTHVYDHASQRLLEIFYDHRGELLAFRQNDEFYYVGLDPHGSPALVLNALGSVAKQIAYDPLGGQISDTAPSFFFPFGFRCGLFEPTTGLVFLGHRAYDSRVGRWMAPDYHAFVENVEKFPSFPEMGNLYQNLNLNSRNSITKQLFPGIKDWLSALGYDYTSLIPTVSFNGKINPDESNDRRRNRYHLLSTVSAFHCAFEQDIENAVQLSTVPRSHLTTAPDSEPMTIGRSLQPSLYLFSAGVIVSVRPGTGEVAMLALESANSTLANVAAVLLNDSRAVRPRLTVDGGRSVDYFVRSDRPQRAAEDLRTLGIQPDGGPHCGLNVTVRRGGGGGGVGGGGGGGDAASNSGFVDVFLQGEHSAMNVRYGADVESETRRVLAEARRQAVDAAWIVERELVVEDRQTINAWTKQQREELLSTGRVANVGAVYIRDVSDYPEAASDPKNIRFVPIKR